MLLNSGSVALYSILICHHMYNSHVPSIFMIIFGAFSSIEKEYCLGNLSLHFTFQLTIQRTIHTSSLPISLYLFLSFPSLISITPRPLWILCSLPWQLQSHLLYFTNTHTHTHTHTVFDFVNSTHNLFTIFLLNKVVKLAVIYKLHAYIWIRYILR